MRFVLSENPKIIEYRIRMEVNCQSDSMPLVRDIVFRRQKIWSKSQSFALACAVIAGDSSGDYLEFQNLVLGPDCVEALRIISGRNLSVTPTNGDLRLLSVAEMDLVSSHVSEHKGFHPDLVEERPGASPLVSVDWFGDFVAKDTRRTMNSRIGMFQTNANLICASDFVSVAVALVYGGDLIGRISVPVKRGTLGHRHDRVKRALHIMAIDLSWVEV